MQTIDYIAEQSSEMFIIKHFAKIKDDDPAKIAIKESVKNLIKHSIIIYEQK